MSEAAIDPFVRAALKRLFKPTGFFDICRFDEICEALNVIPPKGYRARLKVVHCVSYSDMDDELRQEIGRMVYETLNSPGFRIVVEPPSLERGKVTPIAGRLTGESNECR